MAVTLRYQGTSVRFGANLGGTAEVSLSSQCGTEGFFVFRRPDPIIPFHTKEFCVYDERIQRMSQIIYTFLLVLYGI